MAAAYVWIDLQYITDLNFILEFVCIILWLSGLLAAFQFFTGKYCLQLSGLSQVSVCSVTVTLTLTYMNEIDFLQKTIAVR